MRYDIAIALRPEATIAQLNAALDFFCISADDDYAILSTNEQGVTCDHLITDSTSCAIEAKETRHEIQWS